MLADRLLDQLSPLLAAKAARYSNINLDGTLVPADDQLVADASSRPLRSNRTKPGRALFLVVRLLWERPPVAIVRAWCPRRRQEDVLE